MDFDLRRFSLQRRRVRLLLGIALLGTFALAYLLAGGGDDAAMRGDDDASALVEALPEPVEEAVETAIEPLAEATERALEVVTDGYANEGKASWYGPGFEGKRTASGERFDPDALTAAHRTLPFGTRLEVTYPRTGESVVVRINDRGPYAHGRIIDLSEAAAEEIGLKSRGEGVVEIEEVR
jgi:rare lipoprotein A